MTQDQRTDEGYRAWVCPACGRQSLGVNGKCWGTPARSHAATEPVEVEVIRADAHREAIEALEEIRRVVIIEDSYDVDPRHQYQQVKRVQEIVLTALGGR